MTRFCMPVFFCLCLQFLSSELVQLLSLSIFVEQTEHQATRDTQPLNKRLDVIAIRVALQGVSLVSLGAQVSCGRTCAGKVAREDWLNERAEDELSASSLGKCKPENKDEFKGVVEREPVHGTDSALENS